MMAHWVYLNEEGKKLYGEVFPNGKLPVISMLPQWAKLGGTETPSQIYLVKVSELSSEQFSKIVDIVIIRTKLGVPIGQMNSDILRIGENPEEPNILIFVMDPSLLPSARAMSACDLPCSHINSIFPRSISLRCLPGIVALRFLLRCQTSDYEGTHNAFYFSLGISSEMDCPIPPPASVRAPVYHGGPGVSRVRACGAASRP